MKGLRTKTIKRKKTARPLSYARSAKSRTPTKRAEGQPTGAVSPISLTHIAKLLGGGYGGDFDPALTMALCALEDVRRTVRVCVEALPDRGNDPVRELLDALWERADAACGILNAHRVRGLPAGGEL